MGRGMGVIYIMNRLRNKVAKPSSLSNDKPICLNHLPQGFEWVNDADAHRAKWGFKADKAGAKMAFTLDVGSALHASVVRQCRVLYFPFSTASTPSTPHSTLQVKSALEAAKSNGETKGPPMVVQIVYLQSYDRMGRASASCSGGWCGHNSLLSKC